jgi:hypothetical protein
LALIKVYPFKNRKAYIQCTGLHVGSGTVLTAGHCFLGAYRCNDAEVTFGIPGRGALKAKCTQLLMNEAAGSAYTSSRHDYALFRVDQAPSVAVEVQANTREPRLDLSTLLVGYPRLTRPRNRDVLAISEQCRLSSLSGFDVFGRPRAQASVLHNCATVPGMNGGILFSLTPEGQDGGLVALQQAGSIEPQRDQGPLTLTAVDNVAQSLARLSPIQNYRPLVAASQNPGERSIGSWFTGRRPRRENTTESLPHVIASPAEVRIGTHLAEAFPLSISEELQLDVGRFVAAEGSSGYLSIAARVGAGSRLTIKGGDGQTMVFDGTSFFESTAFRRYASPVSMQMETSKDSGAFQAEIKLAPAL